MHKSIKKLGKVSAVREVKGREITRGKVSIRLRMRGKSKAPLR
jgi:hypothetical protein